MALPKFVDLTGNRYGRLSIIKRAENKDKRTMWLCKCDCGNEKIIGGKDITSGKTKSCGCMTREITIKNNTKHNLSGTRLYSIWNGMIGRCYRKKNSEYKNYGGRGISICKEWKDDFVKFYNWANNNGYMDTLSIDRIDVNGNYEPTNCKWANQIQQMNNTRVNHSITINNKTLTVTEWERLYNFERGIISGRLMKGLVGEDLLKPSGAYLIKNEKVISRNKSGYTGVYFNKKEKKWKASIQNNKIKYSLGTFINKEDAIAARIKAEENLLRLLPTIKEVAEC